MAEVGTVYIDFLGVNSKETRPFHFIIHKEYIKVYESGNTAFIYEVNGGVADIYNELQEFLMNLK